MTNHLRFAALTAIALALPQVLEGPSQALAAPARKKPKAKPQSAVFKPVPLTVAGRVSNTSGKPLAGVEVSIYGTTVAGANASFSATTGADGRFRQRVPDGVYGVSAYLKTRFNNKNYNFTLHPSDGLSGKRYDAARGIVKHFTWKISGLKPGETPGEEGSHTETNKYYGGYVHITSNEEAPFAGSTVEIVMTPRGRLIDGSTGKPRTFRKAIAQGETGYFSWHLTNVPIGLYTLSARLVRSGGVVPLNTKRSLNFNGATTPEINIDFEPTQFGDMQMMQVTLDPPPSAAP